MSDAKTAWKLLCESVGNYSGTGINHERQKFYAQLNLKIEFLEKMLSLDFSAIGEQGENFHTECSKVGFDITGTLVLYVVSNNHPGITAHFFNRMEVGKDGEHKIVFRFGNLEDRNSFREEISLNLFNDGSLEYIYSWGMSGGDFGVRSGSRMKRAK